MSLSSIFEQVVEWIASTPVDDSVKVSTSDKLRLYGRYKHVRHGPCTLPAPSRLRVEAYAKHQAWMSCNDLSVDQAMLEYIDLAAQQPNWLGDKCRALLDEWKANNDMPPTQVTATPLTKPRSWLGVSPLLPRGQIDIDYRTLAFAACACLWPANEQRHRRLSAQIEAHWSRPTVVGASVRATLDLYLTARAFPRGSSILMAPPINVPGVLDVLRHHGLQVMGVDLPESGVVEIDLPAIRAAMTSSTVAVMVVHAFGKLAATSEQMQELKAMTTERGVDLLEDWAECFTGRDGYQGSPSADVSFVSFGLIKTATALGGGVAVVGDEELASTMKRLQFSLHQRPSSFAYLRRVLLVLLFRWIASSPWLYGALAMIVAKLGADFDYWVTRAVRSCSSRTMAEIRVRPSCALLAVLDYRLQQPVSVDRRLKQCRALTKSLRAKNASLLEHFDPDDSSSTYWLYPVRLQQPDRARRQLQSRGMDATRGLSQLHCVDASCARATALLDQLLYLPIASQPLSNAQLADLVDVLGSTIEDRDPCHQVSNVADGQGSLTFPYTAAFALPVALCLPCSLWLWLLIKFVVVFMALFILSTLLLRWSIADYYLETSTCFARYSSLLLPETDRRQQEEAGAVTDDATNGSRCPLASVAGLRLDDSEHCETRTVLLTGATGFIGSMLLRELLLHRRALGVQKVILLCRGRRGRTVQQRVSKLLDETMFDFLSSAEKTELVTAVEGDVTKPMAGLDDSDLSSVAEDASVTHVVHCAASVSFTQTLAEAAEANISAALNVQQLAGCLTAVRVQFVHVSTAFVHGSMLGSSKDPLSETLFSLGDFDPLRLYKSMLGSQFYATKAMSELGFHNTYTFSKCVCEHLLLDNTAVETVIFRPSIVGPALESPFEGWSGSKPSTLVAAACLYFAYQWNLWSFGDQQVPCIPVDVVARFVVSNVFGGKNCGLAETESEDSYEKVAVNDGQSSGDAESDDESSSGRIFNVAWDAKSPASCGFSWLQYAVSVTQLGSVMGYFSRPTAYAGLWVTARIFPWASLSLDQFARVHFLLVQQPFQVFLRGARLIGMDVSAMEKLPSFLDLPLLFYPFMNNAFFFESKLAAPPTLDGSRYLFACTVAAERFMNRSGRKEATSDHSRGMASNGRFLRVAGDLFSSTIPDWYWALTQPRGHLVTRVTGLMLRKIFRLTCTEVTVDVSSFQSLASRLREIGGRARIILAPCHRSMFDFLLLSFIAFSLPELQIDLPFIAAADDFERLPVVGWIAGRLGAVFLRRGAKREDPTLTENLRTIESRTEAKHPVVEVFIEGTRSRDRRCLGPKTGLLRCLQRQGPSVIVPISVYYERIPEQEALVLEACGGRSLTLSVKSLLKWLYSVATGEVRLGRIHISAGNCFALYDTNQQEISGVVREIQVRQQDDVQITDFHIEAASLVLRLDNRTVRLGLEALGCTVIATDLSNALRPALPSDSSELVTILLQTSPVLARLFTKSLPRWSNWLNYLQPSDFGDLPDEHPAALIKDRLTFFFQAADECIELALAQLHETGFPSPTPEHVLRVAAKNGSEIPAILLWASINMQLPSSPNRESKKAPPVAAPASSRAVLASDESLGYWGFHDSVFTLQMDPRGSLFVQMPGNRYGLSGRRMTKLLPFIERELDVKMNLSVEAFEDTDETLPVATSRLCLQEQTLLEKSVGAVSMDAAERIRHGMGHAQEDVYLIRSGMYPRFPDAVVWPKSEEAVARVVELASENGWCLIPFGGGTNVSQSTRCPPIETEPRPIVSVDMKKLDQIIAVDEENGVAQVQAGITGRDLVEGLAERGYTMGHEPDSYEFSTLGGWIATKASGMKRSKYGNIEDIVKAVKVAGTNGFLRHGNEGGPVWGRESSGPSLRDMIMGSEGCLGIITSAVIRVWPLPAVVDYDSILLDDFEAGLRFIRDVARLESRGPGSVRLLDNSHFRLGRALQPGSSSALVASVKSLAESMLFHHAGLDAERVVCVTITYEGDTDDVRSQKQRVAALCRQHAARRLGASVGRAGYELTFMIAYLRDFAMTYHVLGESFETFAPWSRITAVVSSVRARIQTEHERRCLPGRPFVGCRVTQLYHEGVCLYFYLCISIETVKSPSAVFAELEAAARDEILQHGGSLSHHHGIGKTRARYLAQMDSAALQHCWKAWKDAVDPLNIFGARNGSFAETTST